MLATSDIDPVDVTLHKAVVPQPSKWQWILRMSLDERDYLLRYVSLAISHAGGMTPVTRLMIGREFRICPALVDVIASWVMSSEVDDNKLPDDQREAVPPDSWLHRAEQLVPPDWLEEVQQSSSEGWPVAAHTKQVACKSTSRPAKRRKVSSTRQHPGPNQGAAYEAELEELYQHRATLPHQTVTMHGT